MYMRALPAGFIAPCLPTKADTLPSGGLWIHEIKHDGFRIIARKDGERVTLYSRPGNNFTRRFPPIARALTHLRCRIMRLGIIIGEHRERQEEWRRAHPDVFFYERACDAHVRADARGSDDGSPRLLPRWKLVGNSLIV